MGQQGASVLLGELCDACIWLSLDIVVTVWGLQFHLGEVKRTIFSCSLPGYLCLDSPELEWFSLHWSSDSLAMSRLCLPDPLFNHWF